jgi:hypothetical protein
MGNLTRDRGLIREAQDFRPVLGHHLVVCQRLGAGLRVLTVVLAGEEFRRRLLQPASSLAAFAVSADPNWRHPFFRYLKHVKGIYHFTLHFDMAFHVTDPQLVVERLDRDPLTCLEEEATEIFGQAAKGLDWEIICDNVEEMSQSLLASDNLGRFQTFVAGYGLTIDRLTLSRTLAEDELDVWKAEKGFASARQKGRLAHILKMEEKQQEDQLRARDRDQRFIDSSFDTAMQVMTRAAGNVGSFDEIGSAIRHLEELRVLVRNALGTSDGVASVQLAPAPPASLSGGSEVPPGLAGLLSRMGQLFAELIPGQEARSVGRAALHLVGELLADGDGDPGQIENYRDELNRSHRALLDRQAVSPAANHLLRYLQDVEAVQRRLS